MNGVATSPTLYDDWKARHACLSRLPYWAGDYHQTQLRLLSYLLQRYRNSPEASRPARFPLRPELYVDHRAILVLHHLKAGRTVKIASQEEAHQWVAQALKRMSARGTNDGSVTSPDFAPGKHDATSDEAIDATRIQLASRDPTARLYAVVALGRIGKLDDVGLFSDLLKLPVSDDEHPLERDALIHAMQQISGVTCTDFDLSAISPEPRDDHAVAVTEPAKEPLPTGATTPSHDIDAQNDEDRPAPSDERPDWSCSKCNAPVPASFDICWACGASSDGVEDPTFRTVDSEEEP